MQWSDIRFDPSTRELRQFAGLCLLVFGGLACWRASRGDVVFALLFAALALAIGPIGLVLPRAVRPVYVAWMVAAFPIGWVVSKLVIGAMYFGIFTPVALIFRLLGRDALRRRARPSGASYWLPKPMPDDVGRYFRQY